MGDRRLLDAVTERLTIGRRIRILRHRTARWFLPPVRHTAGDAPADGSAPRLRLLPTGAAARRADGR